MSNLYEIVEQKKTIDKKKGFTKYDYYKNKN